VLIEITHHHLDTGNLHDNNVQAYDELTFSATFSTAITTMPTARAEMDTSGAQIITNGPQANPGDRSGSWSVRQNVRNSERYEAVVHSNGRFRANRMQKECGPITDQQLHADCVASFHE
jgi:hypothetical protein